MVDRHPSRPARACSLVLDSGKEMLSVRQLAVRFSEQSSPLLAWAEPDPRAIGRSTGSGRWQDFVPLRAGTPDWPDDLRLMEARLFWSDRSVHIVSDGPESRWAELREETPSGSGIPVLKKNYKVHLTQDRARFGLANEDVPSAGIRMIEYWTGGQLLGWRLVTDTEASA